MQTVTITLTGIPAPPELHKVYEGPPTKVQEGDKILNGRKEWINPKCYDIGNYGYIVARIPERTAYDVVMDMPVGTWFMFQDKWWIRWDEVVIHLFLGTRALEAFMGLAASDITHIKPPPA